MFHGPTPVDKSCIDDNIQNCKDILAGTDDHIPTLHHGHWYYLAKEREREIFRRKDGKFGNILYARAR